MKNFFKSAEKIITTLLFYTIKFDVLLVYGFSRTVLFFVWVLMVILGLFSAENAELFNLFCLLGVMYITGTSFLIYIVLFSKTTNNFVKGIVGLQFLERFAPKKGFSNFARLLLPLFALLLLEMGSLEYILSSQFQDCQAQSLLAREYYDKGDFRMAEQVQDDYLEVYISMNKTRGVVCQLANHPYMVSMGKQICLMLGL